jgi:hypothetical protein
MNNFVFMVQVVGIAVKFVIKYLATGVFLSGTYIYIVVSVHFPVACVIRHSVKEIT